MCARLKWNRNHAKIQPSHATRKKLPAFLVCLPRSLAPPPAATPFEEGCLLLGGGLGLGLVLGTLLALAGVALVGAGEAEGAVGTALVGGGEVGLGDLGEAGGEGLDGEGGVDLGDGLGLGEVGGGVALLGLAGLAGEEDQALLVGLEAGDVGGEALLGEVLAAAIDGDADGLGELAGDAGGLVREALVTLSCCCGFGIRDAACRTTFNLESCHSYLELSQGETTAGASPPVVLDGRAADDGAEPVDGTGGDGGGLGLASVPAGQLLASLWKKPISESLSIISNSSPSLGCRVSPYLVEVRAHPALPILAEVCMSGSVVGPSCRRGCLSCRSGGSRVLRLRLLTMVWLP